MFLQFVVHAHAKSLPTTAAKANPKHRPGRAQRSGVLSGAKRLIPVPTHPPTFENCADHLCCRLKALTLFSVVATKNTDYPISKALCLVRVPFCFSIPSIKTFQTNSCQSAPAQCSEDLQFSHH